MQHGVVVAIGADPEEKVHVIAADRPVKPAVAVFDERSGWIRAVNEREMMQNGVAGAVFVHSINGSSSCAAAFFSGAIERPVTALHHPARHFAAITAAGPEFPTDGLGEAAAG